MDEDEDEEEPKPKKGRGAAKKDGAAKPKAAPKKAAAKKDEEGGEEGDKANGTKRKREAEPSGPATQGQRGQGVPSIGSAPKKAKVETGGGEDAKDAAMSAS